MAESDSFTEEPPPPKIYITRIVPPPGRELLALHCSVTQWESDEAVPREELLKRVVGIDALFCMLTDQIDAEVLDAAGNNFSILYISEKNCNLLICFCSFDLS